MCPDHIGLQPLCTTTPPTALVDDSNVLRVIMSQVTYTTTGLLVDLDCCTTGKCMLICTLFTTRNVVCNVLCAHSTVGPGART